MSLKVLVIGSGMYVAGRGTDGFGTVLPALNEAYRNGLVKDVHVTATSAAGIKDLTKRAARLGRAMGAKAPLTSSPKRGKDLNAYKKALKNGDYDCAIVVVPDHKHCSIACDVLKSNVHTLMVKPLAPTLKEAKQMVQVAKKNNVYAAIEFHKRYDEANLKLRDVINGQKIGDVLYITVGYSQRKMIPTKIFKSWAAKTDIFQYLGVHYCDLIYFATKAKPVRVMATGQKQWLVKKGVNTYDAIQVHTEWRAPNGKKFMSSILTNWIDPDTTTAMSDQKISVVGTKGRFDSDQKNRGVQIVTDDAGIEDFNPYFSQLYGDSSGKSVFQGYGEKSIRQFLKDVQDIKEGSAKVSSFEGKRPTFKDGLVSTAVIEAVKKSLNKNSGWINIGK